jgi:hypothetical protein
VKWQNSSSGKSIVRFRKTQDRPEVVEVDVECGTLQTLKKSCGTDECSLSPFPSSAESLEAALGDTCIAIVFFIATSHASNSTAGDFCIAIVYSVATVGASKGCSEYSQNTVMSTVVTSELSVELRCILGSLRST